MKKKSNPPPTFPKPPPPPEPPRHRGKSEYYDSDADIMLLAYKRGWFEFLNGVKVGDNPFNEKDARHWKWMQGWVAAGSLNS
jgi:hypothetical protein